MMFPTEVEVHDTNRGDGSVILVVTVGKSKRKFHLDDDLANVVKEGLEYEDD